MRALVAALLCAVCAAQTPADEVAKAELAFAKLASEKGISAAFLANLADGAYILNPEPVDARAHYAAVKDSGFLSWRPTQIGVSGHLAYSTGPWEYRVTKDAAPLVQGHFLSVWTKQADGVWKVIFDCGVPHAARTEPEGWCSFLPPCDVIGGGGWTLTQEDRHLSNGRSQFANLAFGATIYRKGSFPLVGPVEVLATLLQEPTRTYEAMGEQRSGSLGLSWGIATAKDGSRVSYCHVWTFSQYGDELLYDLELPIPAKP